MVAKILNVWQRIQLDMYQWYATYSFREGGGGPTATTRGNIGLPRPSADVSLFTTIRSTTVGDGALSEWQGASNLWK